MRQSIYHNRQNFEITTSREKPSEKRSVNYFTKRNLDLIKRLEKHNLEFEAQY
jgi:hypothetical protein